MAAANTATRCLFFLPTLQPSSQPRFGTISLPKGVRLGRQSIKYVRSLLPFKAP